MVKLSAPTVLFASLALCAASVATPAQAGTKEDACSIWLCLPTGFALDGCGKAKTAWIKRLARGKSPLPSWGSCSVGSSTGSYTMGREPYAQCSAGYVRSWRREDEDLARIDASIDRIEEDSGIGVPVCVRASSCLDAGNAGSCTDAYTPAPNPTPEWVEMVIDGKSVGRFYYAMP